MELEVGKVYNIVLKPVEGVSVKINRALFLGVTYPMLSKPTTVFNFQGEVTEFGLPASAFQHVAVVEVVSTVSEGNTQQNNVIPAEVELKEEVE